MPTETVTLTQVVLDSKEHFAEGTEARPVFRTQLVTLGHMMGHMTSHMKGHMKGHMTGHMSADELDPHRVVPLADAHVPSPELGEHA